MVMVVVHSVAWMIDEKLYFDPESVIDSVAGLR